MSSPPTSSVQTTQKIIKDAKECISVATTEVQELQSFVGVFKKFTQARSGKLGAEQLAGYNRFISRSFTEFRSQIEIHVAEIQDFITQKAEERDLQIHRLRDQAYASSLIHRIPLDVLGMIFSECVRDSNPDDFAALKLASVSVAWRNAALRTPHIWSKLSMSVYKEDRDLSLQSRKRDSYSCQRLTRVASLPFARKWIERSGVTPLHVCLSWHTSSKRQDWAQFLSSLNRRLVSYELRGEHDGSSKGVIAIDDSDLALLFGNPLPELQKLSIAMWPRKTETMLIENGADRLNGIESLTIDTHRSILDFFSVWLSPSIRASLHFLSLKEVRYQAWTEGNLPKEIIGLPRLTSLHILSFDLCTNLLDAIAAPALENLHIEGAIASGQVENGAGTVALFLLHVATHTSFPVLREFALSNVKGVDDALETFLHTCPTLLSLSLRSVASPKTMAALAKFPEVRNVSPLCPELERLDVDHFWRERGGLKELIEARHTNGVSPGSYKEADIKFVRLKSLKWNNKESLPDLKQAKLPTHR